MTVEWRWRRIGGEVFRLAELFDSLADTRELVTELRKQKYYILLSIVDERWAMFWRPHKEKTPCDAHCYNILI